MPTTTTNSASIETTTTTTSSPPPHRRCFSFPCFTTHRTTSSSDTDKWWWDSPLRALRKIREWSELVAGPRWKTFIRRFNRTGGGKSKPGPVNFQYDPLSYSLNFEEEGGGGDGDEDVAYYPDFMARYGSVSSTSKMMTTAAVRSDG